MRAEQRQVLGDALDLAGLHAIGVINASDLQYLLERDAVYYPAGNSEMTDDIVLLCKLLQFSRWAVILRNGALREVVPREPGRADTASLTNWVFKTDVR